MTVVSFAMPASSTRAPTKTSTLPLTPPARVSYLPGTSTEGVSRNGESQDRCSRCGSDGPRDRAGGRAGGVRDLHGEGNTGTARRSAREGGEAAPEGGREGQAHGRRSRRAPRPPALDDASPRPRRGRSRDRVDRRGAGGQAGALHATRRRRAGTGDTR